MKCQEQVIGKNLKFGKESKGEDDEEDVEKEDGRGRERLIVERGDE